MPPPPAARRRRLSDSDLTCATTKRRFAALDIYAKATATSAGRSRHELVRLGELKPARRHSFDWLQFCRDGDRCPVARPPLTLFHELRCFYDPDYRLFQVREHLKEVMRGRDMGTKALFDSIDGDGSGEISREELGEAMRTIGVHVKARAGKESEIPNFKGSDLGRFPLVSADFWTSDHLSERSRSVDACSGTRARGPLTLKRR